MAQVWTWQVRATVVRIVDGDTFVADLDLGWGVFRIETKGAPSRIRILNYDTPERGEPDWAEAGDILTKIIPVGTQVWIVSHALDSFGRALCDVFKDGQNILELLPNQWKIK